METPDHYSPARLMSWRLAVSAVERIASDGGLKEREKERLLSILRKRYGLNKKSIFIK